MRSLRFLFSGAISLLLAMIVVPILAVIPASFNASSFVQLPPLRYSTRWYVAFFNDPLWLASFLTSAQVAVLTTILCLILGTLAAIAIDRMRTPWRQIFSALFMMPLVVPFIVTAIALFYVFSVIGLSGTTAGLVIGHSVVALPFVVSNVGVSLRSIDPSLRQAAAGLGATPFRIFRTVTLFGIAPGLFGAGVFAFVTSFDEVILSIFLAGIQSKTLPVKVWEILKTEFTPTPAVAATVMLLVTLVMIPIALLADRRKGFIGAAR